MVHGDNQNNEISSIEVRYSMYACLYIDKMEYQFFKERSKCKPSSIVGGTSGSGSGSSVTGSSVTEILLCID